MSKTFISAMFLACFTCLCLAQTEIGVPIYAVKEPPDLRSIHRAYGGGVKAANFFANISGDIVLANRVAEIHTIAANEASALIDWTGQGVLYELRVMRRTVRNEAGLYDAYIEGNAAVQVSIGENAQEALFKEPDQLRPGPKWGYSYDPMYSHYFFVTREDGKLESRIVPRGASVDLQQALASNFGDLQLKYGLASRSNGERYAAIASAARSRIQDADLLLRLNRAEKVLQDSVANVAKIDKQFQEASEKAQKAAKEAKTLAILTTFVSAAELANRARANISDPALDLNGAGTGEAVLDRVETYEDSQVRITQSLRVELKNGLESYQKAIDAFQTSIAPASPPPQIQKSLSLRPR